VLTGITAVLLAPTDLLYGLRPVWVCARSKERWRYSLIQGHDERRNRRALMLSLALVIALGGLPVEL